MPGTYLGAFNGIVPEPTGVLVGYLRDPKTFPYLRYTQLVPAPEVQIRYWVMNRDEPIRVPTVNDYVWGYDDYRPTGRGFNVQGEWKDAWVTRWDFPYTIGETTLRVWRKSGIDLKALYDEVRGTQFQVHRAYRVVKALTDATWPSYNTASVASLLGASNVYWNNSLGTPKNADDTLDPRFQVIKKTLNRIKRRIHLSTAGVVQRLQLYCIIPPVVAEAISETHEIQEVLKQSPYARDLLELPASAESNARDWNLPESYAGFTFIVEDTPRVKIQQKADGSIADVSQPSQVDYVLDSDTVYIVSRQGALDGLPGSKTFSTVQLYHYGGEARVEAFTEPKHELIEGHIVAEDAIVLPSLVSGFKLTDVLAP